MGPKTIEISHGLIKSLDRLNDRWIVEEEERGQVEEGGGRGQMGRGGWGWGNSK